MTSEFVRIDRVLTELGLANHIEEFHDRRMTDAIMNIFLTDRRSFINQHVLRCETGDRIRIITLYADLAGAAEATAAGRNGGSGSSSSSFGPASPDPMLRHILNADANDERVVEDVQNGQIRRSAPRARIDLDPSLRTPARGSQESRRQVTLCNNKRAKILRFEGS